MGAVAAAVFLVRSREDQQAPDDALGRARRWAATVESYAFSSEVTVTGGTEPQTLRIEGQVADRGEADVPDLLATIATGDSAFGLLRLDGRIWTRAVSDDPWAPAEQAPALTQGVGRRVADLLEAFEARRTERTEAGWEVTGSTPAQALGIQGTGDVGVRLALDGAARLRRVAYTATLRTGPQDDRELEIETVTSLRDFDETFDWPPAP